MRLLPTHFLLQQFTWHAPVTMPTTLSILLIDGKTSPNIPPAFKHASGAPDFSGRGTGSCGVTIAKAVAKSAAKVKREGFILTDISDLTIVMILEEIGMPAIYEPQLRYVCFPKSRPISRLPE